MHIEPVDSCVLLAMVEQVMLENTSRSHQLLWIHIGTVTGSHMMRMGKGRRKLLPIIQKVDGFDVKVMQGQHYYRRKLA